MTAGMMGTITGKLVSRLMLGIGLAGSVALAPPSVAGEIVTGKCVPVGMWFGRVGANGRVTHAGPVEDADGATARASYRYDLNFGSGTATVYEIYKGEFLLARDIPFSQLGKDRISLQHTYDRKYIFTHLLDVKKGYGAITDIRFEGGGIFDESHSVTCVFVSH